MRFSLLDSLAIASVIVPATQATPETTHITSHVPGKAFDRFVTIWLENTDYSKAAGDPSLVSLAKKGITLSNYFAVTHPSQPNYISAIGGDHFGLDGDALVRVASNTSTVIDLLEDRSISWGEYQEDMPYSGYQGFDYPNQKTRANDYVRKHNPAVIYDANTTPDRLAQQKNLTQFYVDLNQQTLPQWIFITPNMTSDGHDSSVTTAGQWTRNFLEPLLQNQYFTNNTLILVTFDENHSYASPNRVFSFLIGGAVPSNKVGTTDSRFYNHYSEISTVEANWDLSTLGRFDVGANVFDLVAQQTGDVYRSNDAATGSVPSRFYNSSYSGPLNSNVKTAYPNPNVTMVSPKTQRRVLPAIANTWNPNNIPNWSTYYTDTVVAPDGQHPPAGH